MTSLTYHHAVSLLILIALLTVRLTIAFTLLPMFASNTVPASVRFAVVAGLSLCLIPLLGNPLDIAALGWGKLLGLLIKEGALGAFLGFLASLSFWAVYAAGTLVEYQAGLSMSTLIDPLSGQEGSMVGSLFQHVFTVVFFVSGGFLSLLGLFYESYRLWPIDQLTPILATAPIVSVLAQSVGHLIESAVRVAIPFVLLMLAAEIGIGLLGRLAPQFNAFFLALPIKITILLVLLLFYCLHLADASGLPEIAGTLQHFMAGAR